LASLKWITAVAGMFAAVVIAAPQQTVLDL
jgi:hypothetical protein